MFNFAGDLHNHFLKKLMCNIICTGYEVMGADSIPGYEVTGADSIPGYEVTGADSIPGYEVMGADSIPVMK